MLFAPLPSPSRALARLDAHAPCERSQNANVALPSAAVCLCVRGGQTEKPFQGLPVQGRLRCGAEDFVSQSLRLAGNLLTALNFPSQICAKQRVEMAPRDTCAPLATRFEPRGLCSIGFVGGICHVAAK